MYMNKNMFKNIYTVYVLNQVRLGNKIFLTLLSDTHTNIDKVTLQATTSVPEIRDVSYKGSMEVLKLLALQDRHPQGAVITTFMFLISSHECLVNNSWK